MKEKDYLSLCRESDNILNSSYATFETVAIQCLHVIREHPVFLKKYTHLFSGKNDFIFRMRLWRRKMYYILGWYKHLIISVFSDGREWYTSSNLPEKTDVLFISHILNSSDAGAAADFYFDALPEQLTSHGRSVVIAMINHTGISGGILAKQWEKSNVLRLIFSFSLKWCNEISIHRRLKNASKRLRKISRELFPGLSRKVVQNSIIEAHSPESHFNLRIAEKVFTLVSLLQPKTIIMTHEGHAWERLAFASARRASPDIRCIGYQHAALFRLQHAIRRNLASDYNPDYILTAGSIGKHQLEQSGKLSGINISIIGSNRCYDTNTNSSSKYNKHENIEKIKTYACLVVPEGIIGECNLLFEISTVCARKMPEVLFIWRLHPVLSFEFLIKKNRNLKNLPNNIILSRSTFREDLNRCKWVLYRGSTAVVQAVMAGLRPIYFNIPGEMTIDPLYELDEWRVISSNVSDIERIIGFDKKTGQVPSNPIVERTQQYCRNFFMPLRNHVLERILTEPIIHHRMKVVSPE